MVKIECLFVEAVTLFQSRLENFKFNLKNLDMLKLLCYLSNMMIKNYKNNYWWWRLKSCEVNLR
jgi:hypothetical protein